MSRYLCAVALAFVAACTSPTTVPLPDAAPAPQPQADADQVPGVPQTNPHIDAIAPAAPTPDGAADLIPILPMDAAQVRDIAGPDLIPILPMDAAPDIHPDGAPDAAAPDTRPTCPTALTPGNLVPSGGFDTSAAGWTVVSGRWDDAQDVEQCPASGSLLIDARDDNPTGAPQATTTSCVPLVAGRSYELAFDLLGDGTVSQNGGCGIRFDNMTELSAMTVPPRQWIHRTLPVVPPAGATCGRFFCTLTHGIVWIDRVTFAEKR